MIETVERDPVRRIEAEVAEAAGALNAAHGRLVQLAADLIDGDLWRGYGIKSVEHWLCWHAGLSPQRARQITSVARRRSELPVTLDTLSRGELSMEQMSEVARYTPAHNDAEAASFAKVATVTQLRGTLSRYRFAGPDPESPDGATRPDGRAHDAVRRGSASMSHDGDRFGLHVDAPVDDGAVITQALVEAKDALFQSGQPDVTWMDALLEVCSRSLSSVKSERRQSRFRVYVHLDSEGGWLNQGPALPDTLLAKICCDGVIQPLWETDGLPVNVGRSQRIVTDRTRRLVLDRDRTCIVPGCGSSFHLEVHHLVPWSRGGRTDTPNLACLCPFHHDARHRGELGITGDADHPESLRFTDALGREMPSLVPPTVPGTCLLAVRPTLRGADRNASRYRHPPGERIDRRWVHFTPARDCEPSIIRGPNAPPA